MRLAPLLPLLMSSPIGLCEEPSTADRIRGNYENKIRFFAAPEKIFETFANVRNSEGVFMSYKDFFHSLTPYNYDVPAKGKADYFEKFQPEILSIADANHDQKIDFDEYIFFVTLLQLPESEIMRSIEKINPEEHKVNREQFAPELAKLRKMTALGQKQYNKSFMPDGRKITTGEKELTECITEHLFKNKEYITIDDVIELKRKLKQALLHYEFHQFDVDKNGTISAEDFAKSLLSCLSFSQATKYMRRINSLDLKGRVSFDEYVAFHGLIEKADIIKMKIALFRYLSRAMLRELCDDFQKVDPFCQEKGVSISDTQIDTFMKILDEDGNGMLDYEEVVDVLEGKKNIGLGKEAKFKNDMLEKFDKYYKKFQRLIGLN